MMKTMNESNLTRASVPMSKEDVVIDRLKKANITRFMFTYKDSAKGTGVVEYNNGVFQRFIMVDGDPQLSKLEKVPFSQVLRILDLIKIGRYTAMSYILFNNTSVVEKGWA